MLMENFMNGDFKFEWTKLVLCFFLTEVNIWKFSRIMLMNFSSGFDYSNSGYINHIPDPYFMLSIVVSLISLIMYTKIFFPLYGSIVWYQVMQQIWYLHMTSVDPMLLFFGMEICINTSVFWMFSVEKSIQLDGLATGYRWVSDIQQLLSLRALVFLVWLLGNNIAPTLF